MMFLLRASLDGRSSSTSFTVAMYVAQRQDIPGREFLRVPWRASIATGAACWTRSCRGRSCCLQESLRFSTAMGEGRVGEWEGKRGHGMNN